MENPALTPKLSKDEIKELLNLLKRYNENIKDDVQAFDIFSDIKERVWDELGVNENYLAEIIAKKIKGLVEKEIMAGISSQDSNFLENLGMKNYLNDIEAGFLKKGIDELERIGTIIQCELIGESSVGEERFNVVVFADGEILNIEMSRDGTDIFYFYKNHQIFQSSISHRNSFLITDFASESDNMIAEKDLKSAILRINNPEKKY